MPDYMLLLRGGDFSDVDATEMKEVVAKYMAYAQKLKAGDRLIAGEELKDQVTLITGVGGDSFAERDAQTLPHERVGGYFIFSASNLEAAIDIADECPHNMYGGYMELRQINN